MHGLDRPFEPGLATEGRHELDLCARQVEAGRRHEQVADVGRLDAVLERHVVHQHVVHRRLEPTVLDAEPGRGVALRIEVDDQRPQAHLGQAGTGVDGGGGLADAALLIGDGDHTGQLAEPRAGPPGRRSSSHSLAVEHRERAHIRS